MALSEQTHWSGMKTLSSVIHIDEVQIRAYLDEVARDNNCDGRFISIRH